jgi:hypothetical protein
VVPDGTDRPGVVARIAEVVPSSRGVDFVSALPAKGWTNATWLAGELVIRVAPTAGPRTCSEGLDWRRGFRCRLVIQTSLTRVF